MTITDLRKSVRVPNRWQVFIDGDYAFSLSEVDLLYHKLTVDLEISEERFKNLKSEVVLVEARDRAARFLGGRARTRVELERKLEEIGYPADISEQVLAQMERIGYLDDMNCCKEHIRVRFDAGFGESRIKWELEQKGADPALVEKALEESGYSEEEAVLKALAPKIRKRSVDLLEQKDRKKLFDYLLRRGFPSRVAADALKCAALDSDDASGDSPDGFLDEDDGAAE
ncbi:MAG: recombination regulator RecX [Clostridiales bacterium]|jgi:regulatory protein|nr:recombination regulator RecX [Clostridiales bacterium]MDR2752317.1 recombination regulator RecX [Clostridiales bacterium]